MERGIFEECFASMVYEAKEAHYQKSISHNPQYSGCMRQIDEMQKALEASLNPEQKELLGKMTDLMGCASQVYEEHLYKAGLQDGAQLSQFLFKFKAFHL